MSQVLVQPQSIHTGEGKNKVRQLLNMSEIGFYIPRRRIAFTANTTGNMVFLSPLGQITARAMIPTLRGIRKDKLEIES